jgi:uncharacterized protein
MTADFDCRKCGACCVSDQDTVSYIELEAEDLKRLTPPQRKLLVVEEMGSNFLTTKKEQSKAGHRVCAMHVGKVGKTSKCGIYAQRPRCCSEFKPGNRACLIARADVGLPTE